MKLRLLFTLLIGYCAFSQVYQHDFGTTSINTHPYTSAPNILDANLASSSWSNSTGNWTSFAGATGEAISLNNSSGTPSITLTFNVASGYQLSITQFDFWRRRSSTGAQNWSMSINGINVGSGTVPTSGSSIGLTNVLNTVSNLTGTISVVISLSGASGTGTFRLDDFTLIGSVVANCVPATDPSGVIAVTPNCGTSTLNYSLPSATAYWQVTANGMDTNFPTTSSYNVSTSGTYYVRTFDGTCWSTNSISSMVTVSNPVNINTQPTDQFATTGLGATFSVVANNASSYQWQVSTDGGGSWVNVGTNSSSYTTPSATLAMNGNQYQVIISGTSPCTSITSDLATLFVTNGTTFRPGELIFTGFDGQINGSGANDEYLIATLVDIVPGTVFSIVNSRYEAGALAGVRTDKWGGGGDDPSEAPYEVVITYNGATSIPAGSVLQIITNNSPIWFGSISVITGTTSTNRTSDFSGSIIGGTPNISTSSPDQMYLIQGSFVSDGTIDLNEANYYLTGKLLHGLTNRAAWVPLANACSGSSSTSSSNPRESRLPSALTCFNVESVDLNAVSGYYENDKEHGIASLIK